MGQALAMAASKDFDVTVVSGPVNLDYGVRTIDVQTADEMLEATLREAKDAEVVICAAAVCDFKPVYHDQKLKKGTDDEALSTIHLVANPDILKEVSALGKFTVGFSAETENVLENVRAKMARKGCNMIVANDVSSGKVFGKDETSITIVTSDSETTFKNISKQEAAQRILECIERFFDGPSTSSGRRSGTVSK